MPESLETTVDWGVMVNRAQNLQGEACGFGYFYHYKLCKCVTERGTPSRAQNWALV